MLNKSCTLSSIVLVLYFCKRFGKKIILLKLSEYPVLWQKTVLSKYSQVSRQRWLRMLQKCIKCSSYTCRRPAVPWTPRCCSCGHCCPGWYFWVGCVSCSFLDSADYASCALKTLYCYQLVVLLWQREQCWNNYSLNYKHLSVEFNNSNDIC